MMNNMMGDGMMMWGMGLLCLLVILVLILGAAALLKYLFYGKSQHLNGGQVIKRNGMMQGMMNCLGVRV
jgi:hypothetical protein